MIRKVNGINFWGSPGATMSQSFVPSSPQSTPTGLLVGTEKTIGQMYIDRGFLVGGVDYLDFTASFKLTGLYGDYFNINVYYGTSSTIGGLTNSNGILIASATTSTTFAEANSIVTRKFLFTKATEITVQDPSIADLTDWGDSTAANTVITIPDGNGFIFVTGQNANGSTRNADTLTMEYMALEPIYDSVRSGAGWISSNQGIFTRNGVGFSNDGFLPQSGYVTVTGTTSITTTGKLQFNQAIRDGDLIRIEARLSKVGTAGNYTIRWYYNTSDTLTGATQLMIRSQSSTLLSQLDTRRIYIYKADGSGLGSEILDTATGYFQEFQTSAVQTYDRLPLDWTVNCWILVTVQLSNTGDRVTCDHLIVHTYN